MKKFHFLTGLPRSGSTLLSNILCQNPRFFSTPSSGVIEIIAGIRNGWDSVIEFQASPNEGAKKRVIRGVFDSFYSDIERPVVFDKSRGWPMLIETLNTTFQSKVKLIACVRDVRDILASFEKIWRRDSALMQIPQERENQNRFKTLQGRVDVWLEPNQPVGSSWNYLADAIKRGFHEQIYIVDFDDLTNNPEAIMKGIYTFLGEESFIHDFDNVIQVTHEDDTVYGFSNLHTIRNKVEPMKPQWPKILGKEYERYGSMNFWKE